jgi:hypothetical protein
LAIGRNIEIEEEGGSDGSCIRHKNAAAKAAGPRQYDGRGLARKQRSHIND